MVVWGSEKKQAARSAGRLEQLGNQPSVRETVDEAEEERRWRKLADLENEVGLGIC